MDVTRSREGGLADFEPKGVGRRRSLQLGVVTLPQLLGKDWCEWQLQMKFKKIIFIPILVNTHKLYACTYII